MRMHHNIRVNQQAQVIHSLFELKSGYLSIYHDAQVMKIFNNDVSMKDKTREGMGDRQPVVEIPQKVDASHIH